MSLVINDRFTRGWIAGTFGGLLSGLFSQIPFFIGVSSLRLTDWSAILIYGRVPPFSFADELYALVILAGSMGIFGIVFAFLLIPFTEKNIYFKGWVFYQIPWELVYLLTALAKTDGTLNLSVMTTLSNGFSTSIIGLATVFCWRKTDPDQPVSGDRIRGKK